MKRTLPLWLLLCAACAGMGQGAASFAVPSAQGNAEGNSSVNDFLNSSTFRMQLVFDASQFAIPAGASGRINSISFRLDGASSDTVQYVFGGGSVTASHTPVGPDALSPVFVNNVGAGAVTIYSGALNFGAAYFSGQSPQPFAPNISATTPFWFRPDQGNLLLDLSGAGGQVLFSGSLDAQNTFGDSVSRVFAASSFASSGTADTLGLVTRVNMTVVPEPSTTALLLTAAATLGLSRCFKKSRASKR